MRRFVLCLVPLLLAAAPTPPGGDAPTPPGGDASTPPSGDAPTPPGGDAVQFQVLDEAAPTEISEDTVIFIDGHQVAHFVLDHDHTAITANVTLPPAAQYDYALCGRITIARPDGRQEQRVVDGGATLKNVNGHLFLALETADFTVFYLADAKDDPPDPPKDVHHTNACSLPVS